MISTQTPHALHERSGEILALLEPAAELYYRLILVVGRGRSGKSTVLRKVAAVTGGTVINIGLLQVADLNTGTKACPHCGYRPAPGDG